MFQAFQKVCQAMPSHLQCIQNQGRGAKNAKNFPTIARKKKQLCRENMREGSQYWRVVKSDQRLGRPELVKLDFK